MTRSWWENEEIIRGFRDWLTHTAEEIEALDEGDNSTSAHEPADDDASWPTGGAEIASSGDDTNESAAREADQRDQLGLDLPDVGLLQLVEAFTAMRHELKLQTKGTRNLEASVAQSLEGLASASRTFQSVQANEQEAVERATRPVVEALVELDEGLRRAVQAFQATHRQMTRSAPSQLRESLDEQFQNQTWWRRFTARRWHAHVREAAAKALAQSTAEEFANLMQGFELIQARLARTLQQLGIDRLDETGGQVDPSRMTVVELVVDADAPPETVVEVVRPGYVWGARVVRFAEVRAVASRATQLDHDPNQWDEEDIGNELSEEETEAQGKVTNVDNRA